MTAKNSPDTILTALAHGAQHHCFGCGTLNRSGLRLKFFTDPNQQVVAPFRLAKRFEGPHNYAHGGIIATLLDEAMSKANRQHGVAAMTRHIEIDYLRPVPIQQPLTLTARHISAEGRKHRCEAEITDASGTVLAKSQALFIAIDSAKLSELQ